MKSAIIDIGSNSIRLLFDGNKYTNNTQLAERLLQTGSLLPEAMERTKDAIVEFAKFAKENGAENVYPFATEAVRSAKNKEEFISLLKQNNLVIDVIESKIEGLLGFIGAYDERNNETIAVLDIGGASSELTVGNKDGIIYTHSMPLGTVRLKDYSLVKEEEIKFVKKRIEEYGSVPPFSKLVAIGGSASTLCSIYKKMKVYNPDEVHNFVMTKEMISNTADILFNMPIEDRKTVVGLNPKKILVAPAGGVLLTCIMDYLNVNEITLSEKDNLEGYAIYNHIEI